MDKAARDLQEIVWSYYRAHGRHELPWRQPAADGAFDPYRIWVSEIMLQQTQVSRVLPKYEAFLLQFPSLPALAAARLGDVLHAWQGLGYNRRAKFLWEAARTMVAAGGHFPRDAAALERLPGIGRNTAGAILAYAFNAPAVFVETNIRTVFIHHFFAAATSVPDREILTLVQRTLDVAQPREWYWALMDYGAFLKQTVGNLARHSRSYSKQSPFAGSVRQLRGRVLRELTAGPQSPASLHVRLADERAPTVLARLEREGLIRRHGSWYQLP